MTKDTIRETEKALCKKVWTVLNERLDLVDYAPCSEGALMWIMNALKDELEEVLPYGPEEVKDV